MIATIHQPNFAPWTGFFHKMSLCDVFVLLDNTPYSKNSYQNRCRIKTSGGGSWLTVPVVTKGRFGQLTKDVEIAQAANLSGKPWRTLSQAYAPTEHWSTIEPRLEPIFAKPWTSLSELCTALIVELRDALGIETKLVKASELECEGSRSELLASICHAVGAETYVSGPSGRNYLDLAPFERVGVKVAFHGFSPPVYPQAHGDFVPALSAIDLLANCGPDSLERLRDAGSILES